MRITGIEIIPIRLPLRSRSSSPTARFLSVESVLVRMETDSGLTGWGEGTPDADRDRRDVRGLVETLRAVAPALLGRDPRDRSGHGGRGRAGERSPIAKAALDIALHDLVGRRRLAGLGAARRAGARGSTDDLARRQPQGPGGRWPRTRERHVANGFRTVKLKVGVADDARATCADWRRCARRSGRT